MGFDFTLLCHCNHSIISRGSFSNWIADWTGGEYYTEYGSIVPNEINDAIEEELRQSGQKSQTFVYGDSKTGDTEGLLFPDLKIEGQESEVAEESSSWFW